MSLGARLASYERSALAQLSVLAGAFSAQAAADVARANLPVLTCRCLAG